MFPMRASKLYEIYRSCNGIQEIPAGQRMMLEKSIFQDSLENVWKQTRDFFLRRDPAQVERAEKDPKHLMALVFRSYLGKSSQWATTGDVARKIDYQIWCGPSMGAFNEWAKGSFLEHSQNRKVDIVALNLLFGASVVMRINNLRWQGIPFSPDLLRVTPMDAGLIKGYLN